MAEIEGNQELPLTLLKKFSLRINMLVESGKKSLNAVAQ